MLFDSHAHYEDNRFKDDRDELLSSMNENNVGYIMNSCSSISDFTTLFELSEKYPFLYISVGVHPHEVKDLDDADMDIIKQACKREKVKAIGEIGLDYFYDNSPRDLQKKWFARQIELAKEVNLPIVIHDRDAHADTMDILRKADITKIGGEFHCYAGSVEMAREILNWGMYIAFGGTLTFKNARKTIEVAEYVPLDRILLETDSPYLTPEPHRGERNSSLCLKYVAEKLAEIKGVSVEEVERITTENAKKCFRI